jgi:dUTP pyrophosphatase
MNKIRQWLRRLIEWIMFEENEFYFQKVSLDEWCKVQPIWFNRELWIEKYFAIKLPERATDGSGGYDICAPYDIKLPYGQDEVIPTGLKASMGLREMMLALPKSGLGFKFFVRLANTVGLIDSDYYNNINNEGHIMIKIRNESNDELSMLDVKEGKGFCQVVVVNYKTTRNDKASGKRIGGFGSTN